MITRTGDGFAQFFYRVNCDKSMDAICGHCFQESSSSGKKEDLRIWEAAHRCANWMKQSA